MKLGFFGFGNMAQAMLKGLLLTKALSPEEIGATALHKDKLRKNCEAFGIKAYDEAAALAEDSEVFVIAVKPYQLDELLPPLLPQLKDKCIINVAAGKTFRDIEALLPGTRHISTGPNLAMAVGEGIMALENKHSLQEDDLHFIRETFGKSALLEFVDTDLLGISGSLSGCGPAFTAMYAEALADAGVKHGLKRDAAKRLTAQMLLGSAKLLQGTYEPSELKDKVCSPGGTTIRGVSALEKAAFRGAVIGALDAVEG